MGIGDDKLKAEVDQITKAFADLKDRATAWQAKVDTQVEELNRTLGESVTPAQLEAHLTALDALSVDMGNVLTGSTDPLPSVTPIPGPFREAPAAGQRPNR